MVTDDERREVAERLRGYVSEWRDMPSLSVQKGVACSLGIVMFDVESQLLRLADLIEPSEPEGTCGNCKHFIKDRFMPCAAAHGYTEADVSACEDFSPLRCDREALLALAGGLEADADRIIKAAKNAQFGVGPRMSEAKLDAAEWRSIARRIREACGEVVG